MNNSTSSLKQVESEHYDFASYMAKPRWCSVWHQADEINRLHPKDLLEIGPGSGILAFMARHMNIAVTTMDVANDLQPDILGSVTKIPCADASFDVVCAFQVLEHLPYEQSLLGLREMLRVARKNVIISLPDVQRAFAYQFQVPGFRSKRLLIPKPILRRKVHRFDGQHYWEINKRGYEWSKVAADFNAISPILRSFRVFEKPNHRFCIFGHAGQSA